MSSDDTASAPAGAWSRLRAWLHAPEAAAGLAVYRVLWGAFMAWESWRYLAAGWVHKYYVAPSVLFKYFGFEWVHALPGPGMTAVYVVMIVSGVAVALGLAYRLASAVFFVAHTYAFLLAAANYLNHAYLIALLAFVMIFLPAHRTLSVDAYFNRAQARQTIGQWARMLLIAQLAIVYAYGGIAKLNTDWLYYQQPVRRWMVGSAKRVRETNWLHWLDGLRESIAPNATALPQQAYDLVASEGFTQFVAYGGVAFDLLIGPALLWRRTRPYAALAAAGFHISNMHLFSIGVFPWLMLAATTLFFEPDWPRRVPGLGRFVVRLLDGLGRDAKPEPVPTARVQQRLTGLWVGWLALQVLIPLRHHLIPGDVAWTEEGHYYAWRMKLRSKKGTVAFRVVDPATGKTWTVDPKDELSKRQARKLRGKPELIRQYANHLVRRYRAEEGLEVDVYVDAFTSLNYRKAQRYIDPEAELGHAGSTWGAQPWVLPMTWTEPPHPSNRPKARAR
ncbi:MAG: HTTM domain-containing protein [Myxococcota bacterium]